jgi:hypothetical protein
MRLRSVCRALLALDVAYCAASLVVRDLPGWKMFDAPDRESFAITAGDGSAVDAYAWVPRGVPELDGHDALRIARWLCAEGRIPAPVRVDARRFRVTLSAQDCASAAHAPW